MAFQRFNPENDIVENQRTTISSGLWSGGSATLTSFFTQSTNGNITGSVLELYNVDPNTDTSAETQIAVGYANIHGSGSAGNTTKLTTGGRQTTALYRQFRNVILAPNTDEFTFSGAPSSSDDFYFISFQRARQREKIDPGNWELQLDSGTNKIRLIDDSSAASNVSVDQGGRVFNVVTGSITNGVHTAAANEDGDGGFGLFYPDLGIILLNAAKLDDEVADISTARSVNTFDFNGRKLYNSIVQGAYFQARREEEISSTSYFCRANNKNFNFSSNPTFSTGSDGSLTQGTFFKDPKTFITQVGLYNDENELLAIAKLTKPLLKSYSREAIIKVKLDF